MLNNKEVATVDQSLPQLETMVDYASPSVSRVLREDRDPVMGASDEMVALQQQVKSYEEELTRLRVENDQLRRSSQAFGELAERLSIALQTANRVNRRSTAADSGGRRRAHVES